MSKTHPRIEDYALIGDCESAALINKNSSIDWLCWPRFDSEACFAALLGRAEHGRWIISAECEIRRQRRYRENTLVLETSIETETGSCDLVDFMPIRSAYPDLVRMVFGRQGQVTLNSELALRFDYGRLEPWIKQQSPNRHEAVSGPHAVTLIAPCNGRIKHGFVRSELQIRAGQTRSFVLTYRPSHHAAPPDIKAAEALEATQKYWTDWTSRCTFQGPWRERVLRSLITVKALTFQPTGGLVAAPTTSLPERIGGERNWDYRFCWLRDASFTLQAFLRGGYGSEAAAWRDWLLRAAAGMPQALQPIYGIAGEHRIEEREIPWLPGFSSSSPVRTGNQAHCQLQLDVFGELLDTMHLARKGGLPPEQASWLLQFALVDHLASLWKEPDHGIWEVRSGREHFTHSKIMTWVAFDRAIQAADQSGIDAPVERWRAIREEIHRTVCARGFNSELGSFVRTFDGKDLDASLLIAPLVGFVAPDDARMLGTVRAIEKNLMRDGFVLRYDTEKVQDGLRPGEGAFLACSLWYADNLALQGRISEARTMFERAARTANDIGLLSEEFDPRTNRQLGNCPQALSHIALIDTAYRISDGSATANGIEATGAAPESPRPPGEVKGVPSTLSSWWVDPKGHYFSVL